MGANDEKTEKTLRQKVKDSLDPYLEGEISELENDFSSIDAEDEDLLKELEEELKEEQEDSSEDLDDWDKWSFSSKISPPSPRPHIEEPEEFDAGMLKFDPQRSSHLWKSDPEVPEYRSFGSLREKNNNVLAANLRKYQNEILSGTA